MRAVITEQDVFDACARIRALGQEPTTLNVYDALGKKGSYSTIGRHIEAWQAANPPAPPTSAPAQLPDSLQQAALQFIAALWGKAAKDAADGYALEKQALNQEAERWKNEREALYQRLMELDEEHDKLSKEHEVALEEIERLKAENKHLEGERDALQNSESRFRAIEETLEKLQHPDRAPKPKSVAT